MRRQSNCRDDTRATVLTPVFAAGLTSIALGAAAVSAVAGIGGGTILIAVLLALGLAPLPALALHAAVQLVSNLSRAVAYRRDIDWRHGGLCVLVALPLPFIVTPWLVALPAAGLQVALALFVLLSLLPAPARVARIGLPARMIWGGVLKGALGPVVGASGLLLAPFFYSAHWRKEQTVATLAMVQAAGHTVKGIAYLLAGVSLGEAAAWFPPLALGVIAGTLLGRRLMGRVSPRMFTLLVRVILTVLGLRLLVDGLVGLGFV
ncbi:MAG: sulfite exporter TauE/SafE family protein [Oceanococcaceae bacterium]